MRFILGIVISGLLASSVQAQWCSTSLTDLGDYRQSRVIIVDWFPKVYAGKVTPDEFETYELLENEFVRVEDPLLTLESPTSGINVAS